MRFCEVDTSQRARLKRLLNVKTWSKRTSTRREKQGAADETEDAGIGSSELPWEKEIVCAQFCLPLVLEPGVDLDLNPANWQWVHCLTLPLKTLSAIHLSRRPYRWILYFIRVVVLVGARGTLSAGPNSNVDLDFDGPLTESADLRYYISDDEKRRMYMFPVDSDIAHHF